MDENTAKIKKIKEDILLKAFQNLGYSPDSLLTKEQISKFLDNRVHEGKFDPKLTNVLFIQIGFHQNPGKKISVRQFVEEYIKFDKIIRRNAQEFEMAKEYDIAEYNKLDELIKKYERDIVNSEGLTKESKVIIKITDVDIKKKIQGIKSIIIKVIFNKTEKELVFDMGGEVTHLNQVLEFKRRSRKDYFEFIMKGIGQKNNIFEIGSQVFPLGNTNGKDEYEVEILIPDLNDENNIVAHIDGNITINGNESKDFEKTKERKLRGVKRMSNASDKANDYVRKVKEVYGKLRVRLPSYTVNYNNNIDLEEVEDSYEIVLNNERESIIRSLTEELNCEIFFNNEMERITVENYEVKFNNTLENILNENDLKTFNQRLSQLPYNGNEPRNTIGRSSHYTMNNNTSPLKNY